MVPDPLRKEVFLVGPLNASTYLIAEKIGHMRLNVGAIFAIYHNIIVHYIPF